MAMAMDGNTKAARQRLKTKVVKKEMEEKEKEKKAQAPPQLQAAGGFGNTTPVINLVHSNSNDDRKMPVIDLIHSDSDDDRKMPAQSRKRKVVKKEKKEKEKEKKAQAPPQLQAAGGFAIGNTTPVIDLVHRRARRRRILKGRKKK
jgi:hypothetical protein